ncbi:MAG: hypothetical protein CMP49_03680 [Flavobacteriales bacterium]|nr:hypothetical protein [Flavobacteriales bacterium]|tara:strand:- start:100 stop:294 length:195 start_codon:yes stop_codon:yes gene_type:complete
MDISSTYQKEKKYRELVQFINNELEYIDFQLSLQLNSKNDLIRLSNSDLESLLIDSNQDKKMIH